MLLTTEDELSQIPRPPQVVALRIQHALWALMTLSTICAVLSLTLGHSFVQVAPIIFIPKITHNTTLLIISYLEKNQTWATTKMDRDKLPTTCKMTALVCSWLVVSSWGAALAPPIYDVLQSGVAEPSALVRTLFRVLKIAFIALEVVALFIVYCLCRHERELMPAHLKA